MNPITNEFSRTVPVSQLGNVPYRDRIEATAEERENLCARLDLLSFSLLRADVNIRQVGKDLYKLEGRFDAQLEQSCVVTLQPVAAVLQQDFVQLFTTSRQVLGDDEGSDTAIDDVPELVKEGLIDMGEAVVQHLAVALDPYPRIPGAAVAETQADLGEKTTTTRPFADLKSLMERKKPAGRS